MVTKIAFFKPIMWLVSEIWTCSICKVYLDRNLKKTKATVHLNNNIIRRSHSFSIWRIILLSIFHGVVILIDLLQDINKFKCSRPTGFDLVTVILI
jgi:hypothetical protein